MMLRKRGKCLILSKEQGAHHCFAKRRTLCFILGQALPGAVGFMAGVPFEAEGLTTAWLGPPPTLLHLQRPGLGPLCLGGGLSDPPFSHPLPYLNLPHPE